MKEPRIVLVTGANRGIGLAAVRKFAEQGDTVILASRDPMRGRDAVASLGSLRAPIIATTLDVSSDESVAECTRNLIEQFGRVDVLVNNAGVLVDPSRHPPEREAASILKTDLDIIRKSLETNTFGAIRMARALAPGMKSRGYGRIVNVSSGMGQLDDMNGGWPGYRLSKLALNGVTKILADELSGSGVLINSVCPGWVRTDMGGTEAELSPEEGADTLVWLANLPPEGPSGKFFRSRIEIPW